MYLSSISTILALLSLSSVKNYKSGSKATKEYPIADTWSINVPMKITFEFDLKQVEHIHAENHVRAVKHMLHYWRCAINDKFSIDSKMIEYPEPRSAKYTVMLYDQKIPINKEQNLYEWSKKPFNDHMFINNILFDGVQRLRDPVIGFEEGVYRWSVLFSVNAECYINEFAKFLQEAELHPTNYLQNMTGHVKSELSRAIFNEINQELLQYLNNLEDPPEIIVAGSEMKIVSLNYDSGWKLPNIEISKHDVVFTTNDDNMKIPLSLSERKDRLRKI